MTLTGLPLGAYLAGLLGLAALLALLQRLRVRHRDVVVPTTVFWREAVEETRARVFLRRFRHPWAYALILLIAALLWTAIAAPVLDGATRSYVLLVDGSAAMSRPGAFEAALDAAEDAAARLPRRRTEVVVCAERAHPVLRPGEPVPMLRRRAQGLAPSSTPASIERGVREVAATANGPTTIVVFGAAPVRDLVLDDLPSDVEVAWSAVPDAGRNRGITGLGLAAAASGAWTTVDVVVEARGDGPIALEDLDVLLDGERLDVGAATVETMTGGLRVVLRDVPANGGRLEARLAGGGAVTFDDAAAQRLPARAPIRVALDGVESAALRAALEADPAVVVVESDPDVVITDAGATDATPALRLVPMADAAHAFLVVDDGPDEADAVARALLADLGLDAIDATGLAQRAGRPITLGVEGGAARRIDVWSELLTTEFDFTGTRAFPLFVLRAVRWLADVPPLVPWTAVGERVDVAADVYRDAAGRRVSLVGAPLEAREAGPLRAEPGAIDLEAALLDLETTAPTAVSSAPASFAAPARRPEVLTVALLLALVLLGVEWVLYQRGRMP